MTLDQPRPRAPFFPEDLEFSGDEAELHEPQYQRLFLYNVYADDGQDIKNIDFGPLGINMVWRGIEWDGEIIAHAQLINRSQSDLEERPKFHLLINLPESSYLDRSVIPDNATCEDALVYQLIISCEVELSSDNSTLDLRLPFHWLPVSDRVRLGESRTLFLFEGELDKQIRAPAPLLTLRTTDPQLELSGASPNPVRSLPDTLVWSFPSFTATAQFLLTDYRLRFIAGQGMQIITLAAGLLLGLLAEPAIRPVEVRSMDDRLAAGSTATGSPPSIERRASSASIHSPAIRFIVAFVSYIKAAKRLATAIGTLKLNRKFRIRRAPKE